MDNYNKRLCVVNEDDNIFGIEYALKGHQKQTAVLHRAFSVFVFNSKNQLLVQERSSEKLVFPNLLANTCCSHPFVNDMSFVDPIMDCKIHAVKRLKYELGIEIHIDDLIFFDRLYYYADDKTSFSKLIGTNVKRQAVDENIINQNLAANIDIFDINEFVEHEIDYLFFCIKDLNVIPRSSEVKRTLYFSEEEMERMMHSDKLAPWLKMTNKQIKLFELKDLNE